VFNDGVTLQALLDSAELKGVDCVERLVVEEVEKRVTSTLCDLFGEKIALIVARSVDAVSPIRKINLLLLELDAVLSDIENFRVLGVRVVPRAITAVPRAIVDELLSLYDSLNDFIIEVIDFLESLVSDCERIKDGET
jgi:hypothetical protein